jgi:RNA polymerase sigma-70 factor (ECF subfamily)
MDEIKLIESYKSWDKELFTVLYDKYIDKVYSFIYFKTYDAQISEDLTSDTFFKALKSLDKFDTTIKNVSFKAWILRIAYNNVVDFYKKKKDEFNIEDIIEKWDDYDIWEDIDNKQKLKEVVDYLKNLKKEHSEILIMRIWDNLSYKEISEITWKSEDNCKQIVSRTLVKINSNITLLLIVLLNINNF